MSITIADEISGKPVVIERPLLAEHIKVGQVLWYNGFTSVGRWDCPAIITRVNQSKKQFRVRSLDDMVEQGEWYAFSADKDPSGSRKTMRVVEPSEVKAYLDAQRPALVEAVEDEKASLQRAEAKLKHFDEILATLKI